MVKSCSAVNCTSSSKYNPGIRFHGFPLKNPALLSEWMIAMKRKNFFPSGSSVLCGLHFTPEDYYISLVGYKSMLKKDAVPSIFSFSEHLVKLEKQPRRIIQCQPLINDPLNDKVNNSVSVAVLTDTINTQDTAVQTDLTCEKLESTLQKLRREKKALQMRLLRRNKSLGLDSSNVISSDKSD